MNQQSRSNHFFKSFFEAGVKAGAVCVLFILSATRLPAQKADTFQLLRTFAVEARFATCDNLGNTYVITPGNAFEKYAPDGRRLSHYSGNRRGNAAALDVSNPLKVLAWYADFRTVVFLDRSLTSLGELNLIAAGFPEVRVIAAAQDGNLWVYDEVNFRLVKITPEGKKLYESQALNQIFPRVLSLTCIRECDNYVYAGDPEYGVLVFDLYAQFQRDIPEPGLRDFQVFNNRFVWLDDTALYWRDVRAPAVKSMALPESGRNGETRKWVAQNRLLLGRKEGVDVYSY